MIPVAELEALRRRPEGRSSMRQEWRDLLFAHYPLPVADVQALLPPGLEVDSFPDANGVDQAWVGVVPFAMQGIRPTNQPAVPWLNAFLETNVRTYVHRGGREPGVWFFSLDAARWLACAYARARFRLPYHHAFMSMDRNGDSVRYTVSRRGDRRVQLECTYQVGSELPLPEAGSFEFWLVERYLLYAARGEELFTGRVFHEPYPLRSVNQVMLATNLPEAAGLPQMPFVHYAFSPGVDVEVFGLERLRVQRNSDPVSI